MTQEEKQLLLKDLCARLLYGVKINHTLYDWIGTAINFNRKLVSFAMEKDNGLCYDVPVEELLPYLRPMSSMTSDERKEYDKLIANCLYDAEAYFFENYNRLYDWLLSHHFDFRGLIHLGLALEAPDGMYKTE